MLQNVIDPDLIIFIFEHFPIVNLCPAVVAILDFQL